MAGKKNYELNEVTELWSIKEMLNMAVKEAGDKNAFRYKQDDKIIDVTYEEFQKDTFYLGTAIEDLKIGDKHIAVIGDNSYNWLTVYLTVLQSRGVIVPLDKELPIKDIINVLRHSDSEVLFYAGKYQKDIEKIKKELPQIKYFIGFDVEEDNGNNLSFSRLKNKGKEIYESGNDDFVKIENDQYDLKMIVYTSGTTGIAKGVMLSEHNLLSVVIYGLQVATIYDSCLSVLPYHHTYEAVAGILVALHHHTTICINDSLKNVLPNIQLFKPEHIYLVPAFAEVFYKKIWTTVRSQKKEKLLKALIKISNGLRKIGIDLRKKLFTSVTSAFGGNLKEIIVGGAPLRAEIGDFFDSIGIDLLNGYGITECSPLVSVNRPKFNNPATVGVILPCCEVKIIDETEEGIGEICVKGDIVMMGYYKDIEKTKEVLSDDGWFKTGDYGYVNDKGQLVITGRKKNIIVLKNGKNVYPEEIENYILGIPYVQEVVVKGSNNSSNLCAEVFLSEQGITEETLKKDIANVTKELPVYKHISEVEIRKEEFNKTTTNKIKR